MKIPRAFSRAGGVPRKGNRVAQGLCLSLLLACLPTTLQAYPERYGPFEPEKKAEAFPLQKCVSLHPQKRLICLVGTHLLGTDEAEETQFLLRVTCHYGESKVTVSLWDHAGQELLSDTLVADYPAFGGAHHADLNGDRKTDFVMFFGSTGNGLAATLSNTVLLLSTPEGYRAVTIESRSVGPEDFVRLTEEGRCSIVQTTFIHGEKGRDGRAHNYWVYHLLEVDGDRVRISERSRLFPKWVWYTHKDNHKETTQLTAEQKRRLWRDYVKQEARDRNPERERFRREEGIFSNPIRKDEGATASVSRGGRSVRP